MIEHGGQAQRQRQCQRVAPDALREGPARERSGRPLHQQERHQAGAEEIDGAPQRGNLRLSGLRWSYAELLQREEGELQQAAGHLVDDRREQRADEEQVGVAPVVRALLGVSEAEESNEQPDGAEVGQHAVLLLVEQADAEEDDEEETQD